MCGIVGYIGGRSAAPLLLEGVQRLEYRGYDSAGVAVIENGGLVVEKAAGRLAKLQSHLGDRVPQGTIGLAHTRWATHGVPNDVNAHPHIDCGGTLAIVHNGIIENAGGLREWLMEQGHRFRSDTDTEVLAHLIEQFLDGSLVEAVAAALRQVEGAYGIAVVCASDPGTLVAARHGSPLLLGLGENEHWVASDAAAILAHTRDVVYLDDGEIAVIRRDSYEITDMETTRVEKLVRTLEWDLAKIERGGHPHFMLKEIMEQPESIRNTLRGHLLEEQGTAKLSGLNMSDDELLRVERVVITACGTSWHAALIGEYMLEELARIPVEVEYASEFRYRNPIVDERTLVIGISQSGETADTLAAIREAKRRGGPTLGIVNVVGSSIAREVDGGTYLHAGPEIGVASTKAFTCQLVALALLTLRLGRLRALSVLQGREIVQALGRLPEQVAEVLSRADHVEQVAEAFMRSQNALYLGRGYNFPVALEGALKLKEISYIHAEGYPAAEMKHGPIALIDDMMPVVFIAPRDAVYQKILSNVEEVKARRGRVLAVVTDGDDQLSGLADHVITVPETIDPLTPVLSVLPLQLFAYYTAVRRGCDVDRPRNLAKSVTVE
ncbi:MAG: glutamine--fructose-6-phosphate transaminase (isomerizing) [Gemmatimonadales bacterium]|nr:glutamine--fructose-6-phosphate transaminase (isomerizing) [Gemmatimonadales bacterium]NIN09797.1 glutamine--fructose-6-phosphate transaminase (isomerizing) [Gemmatimonadales bacterium]NIN48779.1 glutamine--fructose-6-phosphate transaminase (isomerizing) [Gemmatimonadales bacterium]NIP06243.1 glutamine--fructose-6-phosphate transaminase (isomerizing) [Gemmatimonadales bacterium]NIR02664.1 glutamine--fructose-6-phosphate transaminase (isomerizing) [Gemmatimonadales bacterium]